MLRNLKQKVPIKSLWNDNSKMSMMITQQQASNSTTSTASKTTYNIEHDVKRQKFRIDLEPEHEAFINYERLGSNQVLLYHTEVPKKYRNLGLAKILADEAFKYFENTEQKMIITCTYLQKLDKNKTYGNVNSLKQSTEQSKNTASNQLN